MTLCLPSRARLGVLGEMSVMGARVSNPPFKDQLSDMSHGCVFIGVSANDFKAIDWDAKQEQYVLLMWERACCLRVLVVILQRIIQSQTIWYPLNLYIHCKVAYLYKSLGNMQWLRVRVWLRFIFSIVIFSYINSMHMFKHNLQQVSNYIAKECHLKRNQNNYLNYQRMNCKNNNLTWLDICFFLLIYLIYKICNLNVTLCQHLLLILQVYFYDE